MGSDAIHTARTAECWRVGYNDNDVRFLYRLLARCPRSSIKPSTRTVCVLWDEQPDSIVRRLPFAHAANGGHPSPSSANYPHPKTAYSNEKLINMLLGWTKKKWYTHSRRSNAGKQTRSQRKRPHHTRTVYMVHHIENIWVIVCAYAPHVLCF